MHFFRPLPGSIAILDDASLSEVRDVVRQAALRVAMPQAETESCCIAATELCRNHLVHGRYGEFLVHAVERCSVRGLELTARDQGPGLADPTQALLGEQRASGSLGQGLASVRRMMDEIDVDVRLGEGTCIAARKFSKPLDRRQEVGIMARPYRHEAPSGDDAFYLHLNGSTYAGVADGLGHGPEARHASALATRTAVALSPPLPLREVFAACENAMGTHTRGAVMAFTLMDRMGANVQCGGVGNITTQIYDGADTCTQPWSSSGSVGVGRPVRVVAEETLPLAPNALVVMHSDGLKGCDVRALAAWQRHHPIVIAQHLLAHHALDTDDALVLVAR